MKMIRMKIEAKDNNQEKFFIFSDNDLCRRNEKVCNNYVKIHTSEDNVNESSVQKIKNKNKFLYKVTTTVSKELYEMAKSNGIKWSRAIEIGIKAILQNKNELKKIRQNFDERITKVEKSNSYIQNKLWKLIAVLKEKGILDKGEYL
jgi:post-segregation antitoxin (ccd killing protein)